MRKSYILFFMLVVLLLSACGSQQTAVTEENITSTDPVESESEAGEPAVTVLPTVLPTNEIVASSGAAVCTVSKMDLPTPIPDTDLPYPPLREGDLVVGPDDALVTFLEYSEVQCPYCGLLEPELNKLYEAYPEDVKLVFRHLPLTSIHDKASLGSQAMEAAALQGNFVDLKNRIFAEQATWSEFSVAQFEEWILDEAEKLGLDPDQLKIDMNSDAIVEKVENSRQEAIGIGLQGTPSLFVNGISFEAYQAGNRDFATMERILLFWKNIETVKEMQADEYEECPPLVIDPNKDYTATIKTEKGDITLQLFPDIAQTTVNTFVFLANDGWYDDITFHRVIEGHVAQAGDPSGTGFGSPGFTYGLELDPDYRFDSAGIVGMANSGSDANGSQFFITYEAKPTLDGNFTVFGKVIEGMDVAESLTPRDPSSGGNLPPGDKIHTITIQEQ